MTRVTVRYEGDRIARLEAIGHAGEAEAGENIICAAVSVLMQTCVNAIEQIAGLTPRVTVDEARALIAVELPKLENAKARDAQIILRTTLLGLSDISHEYPQQVALNIENGRKSP